MREAPHSEPLRDASLDITRLIRRSLFATPTGIDRVEMAYAQWLLALLPAGAGGIAPRFIAFLPILGFRQLGADAARQFVCRLAEKWASGSGLHRENFKVLWAMLALLMTTRPVAADRPGSLLFVLSHLNLLRYGALKGLLDRSAMRLCVFLHDMIPITHPYFARQARAAHLHRARCQHAESLSALILVNSQDTLAHLAAVTGAQPRKARGPQHLVIPLGVDTSAHAIHPPTLRPKAIPLDRPFFLCLGTIEPRKNHDLLLSIWETWNWATHGARPLLVIAGRKGWKNRAICKRIAALARPGGDLIALHRANDREIHWLIAHARARALLMPSFVEGYGLPVAEALARGTPVLCSDLPAHREIGQDGPDYLAPDRSEDWAALIADYAGAGDQRAAQIRRLGAHRAWTWEDHFAKLSAALGAAEGAELLPERRAYAD